ncbi:MAG TPA: Rrf2 family transcriptional regulator [Fluviicola sp.]|nr:Rrf2 family transcriptional regulator [Fluviicola sp.]
MFSKACEYAIRSSIFIAQKSMDGKRTSLKEIAKEIDSPEAFTAKILQQLARNKIVDSIKGPQGGFEIPQNRIESIKLKDIVFAIDGDAIYTSCGLGMKQCSESHPCPIHAQFKIIKNGLLSMLESTTLKQLSLGLNEGITFLKV